MNTVTVADLGDLSIYTLLPERQRSAVAKLTMVGCTPSDIRGLHQQAFEQYSDPRIAMAVLCKLINGPLQDIATAIQQLRAREERRKANPTLNPTFEQNAERQRRLDAEWEAEQRRKAEGAAAELERKKMPWERLKRVD